MSDRTQAPSGIGYSLENRLVSARTLPHMFRQCHVRQLARFFEVKRNALIRVEPADDPRVVLLTPGPHNETYFEHSFLAGHWGFTLVEGADLTVRDDRVFLKTLAGLEPVDVIVRRMDDDFCDPLELRGDSLLGVPGLVQAVRSGNVAVANALGSGADGNRTCTWRFLPGCAGILLGEELRMPSVATWWCGQRGAARYVLEHLDDLVIKPAFPRFGLHPEFPGRDERGRAREIWSRGSKRIRNNLWRRNRWRFRPRRCGTDAGTCAAACRAARLRRLGWRIVYGVAGRTDARFATENSSWSRCSWAAAAKIPG